LLDLDSQIAASPVQDDRLKAARDWFFLSRPLFLCVLCAKQKTGRPAAPQRRLISRL
jgi:hypothetical protein